MSEPESAGEWYEIEEMWPPSDRWKRAFALRYTKQQAQEVVKRRRKLGIKARIIHCRAVVVATLPEPEGG